MDESIKWIKNTMPKSQLAGLDLVITKEETEKAGKFHKSIPGYCATPLAELHQLSQHYLLKNIFVKDESFRFGLNAFKVLGASYAMACYLAQRLGANIEDLSYQNLVSSETRKCLGDITFYSATDGNHGRAVAWTAKQLGQKSVIYMPKGSSNTRLQNILEFGAKASITEMNYDDAVRYAKQQADLHGGVVVQDTAWEGYEEIPQWIMQGYTTLIAEALEQMTEKPTHVFLQAGVGSFASSVQGYLTGLYGEKAPTVVVVESDQANCYYRSAVAGDGRACFTGGDMLTLMAGLACGEPNTISFELLKTHSQFFVSCPDWVTAFGMRILGNPLGADTRIISGESGAVGMGLLAAIMEEDSLWNFKEALNLNEDSIVLLVSTEGDTDPGSYRDIVWRCKNHY